MPRKGDRIVAQHILAVLTENKGTAMRFSNIKKEMSNKGWVHMDYAILDNLKLLVEQGKIIRLERLFGIPMTREDGTAYLKIQNSNAVIELGKVKGNGCY
ncbi:MAG: hypothetical protein QXF61_07125 [Nitrososphaeria archaeon]